jgi:hypothetical protein
MRVVAPNSAAGLWLVCIYFGKFSIRPVACVIPAAPPDAPTSAASIFINVLQRGNSLLIFVVNNPMLTQYRREVTSNTWPA